MVTAIQPGIDATYGARLQVGQRAGLVFIYSGVRAGENPGAGDTRATKMAEAFRRVPGFANAAFKGLHDLSVGADRAEIEVFFLVKCE